MTILIDKRSYTTVKTILKVINKWEIDSIITPHIGQETLDGSIITFHLNIPYKSWQEKFITLRWPH